MSTTALIEALNIQVTACKTLGSPFCGGLLRAASQSIEMGGRAADLFEPWSQATTREHVSDATALRLLGALHELVLSGDAPDLAAHYPSPNDPGDAQAAWSVANAGLDQHFQRLAAFMAHEPQTNEVGRSACLLLGFLEVGAQTGLPLRMVELGASGGLNMTWDRYAYNLGGISFGPSASPLTLSPEWRGRPMTSRPWPNVVERLACDRRPLVLADAVMRRRLTAYLWPDQFERMARLRAAIDLALEAKLHVEAVDAAIFAKDRAVPRDGVATVLYHSVFWQYLPQETQARLAQAIVTHGRAATPTAPFAWVRLEPDSRLGSRMEIRVTIWPTGDDRLLGYSHPHGTWIETLGT